MSSSNGQSPPEKVGDRIKRLRLAQGLSQRDIAMQGISYAYISRIEAHSREPSMKALRLLAARLGTTPEYLETGHETVHLEGFLLLGEREIYLAPLEEEKGTLSLSEALAENFGEGNVLTPTLRDLGHFRVVLERVE